ncbi:MAG: GGDEF domain-containing protein [Myxococcales bacterium]|nr:GGDEF domain-containing protein [Myxococcales bacterium]
MEDGQKLREELQAAIKDSRRPAVVVISGNEVGLRRRLSQNAVLGRDSTNDVVLTDQGVSWRHARIEDRGDAWVVVDLGSTNGTVVNGARCAEKSLGHGDRIVLGRTVLRFELQDRLDEDYDEQLQRLLHVDDLSGLFVRRRFDRELALMVETARAQSGTVALLVMDMDGIKAINDRHGHLFGAYTIGETGKLIGRVLGARGIASRFGGDEFCAALTGVDVETAVAVAEEIRAAVAAFEYEREGVRLRPGISIGVGVFPTCGGDAERLFQVADEALYRAKQGGKNRVCR